MSRERKNREYMADGHTKPMTVEQLFTELSAAKSHSKRQSVTITNLHRELEAVKQDLRKAARAALLAKSQAIDLQRDVCRVAVQILGATPHGYPSWNLDADPSELEYIFNRLSTVVTSQSSAIKVLDAAIRLASEDLGTPSTGL